MLSQKVGMTRAGAIPTFRWRAQMAIKKTGTYKGKSNKLGYGGRAAQMRDQGVPEAVIGMIARRKGAAPGQKNYHGKRGK